MRFHDSPSRPAADGPEGGRRIFYGFIGMILPLIAGASVWALPWMWGSADMFDAAWPFLIIAVMTVSFAALGGFLLRSWWALLIVPVAWLLGEMISSAIAMPIISGGMSAADQSSMPLWQIYLTTSAVMVVFGGAANALFAALGVLLYQRRHGPATPATAGA